MRNDWDKEEIREIYQSPLLELIFCAATNHRKHHNPRQVQWCALLSIKTGGCSEDCAYCPQSARYKTAVSAQKMLSKGEIISAAKEAKKAGCSRFCLGAAWRKVRDNKEFSKILEIVKEITKLDLEVCCTLGMIAPNEAKQLKEAGLYAYNHNLDTSENFYGQVITTRSYQDRLETLKNLREANLSVCCGGIIGMGETTEDRIDFLHTLATLPKHPESVPINSLIAIAGTPLENQKKVSIWEMVRMVGTARIIMPNAMVRLSAGRIHMTPEEHALCFLAGANSIHTGEQLLTTPNLGQDKDQELMELLGLTPMPAHSKTAS